MKEDVIMLTASKSHTSWTKRLSMVLVFLFVITTTIFFSNSNPTVSAAKPPAPTPTPAALPTITNIQTYGNYETAGVNITFSGLVTTAQSARVYYKKTSESTYREGHNFIKFDGNHMATSLFDLSLNTAYDIKVDYNNSQTVTTSYSTVTTKTEFALPFPVRTVNVGNQERLQMQS
jgi:hypothetical protein